MSDLIFGSTPERRPAVSIILPTYNRAQFLPQAFESISGQTFRDWELIVVDDGSTDKTRELTAAFGRESPRPVRYVHQDNKGAYAARNKGLDLAQGRYIGFFDSDDLWLAHHLDDCVAGMEAHPDVDWVYTSSRIEEAKTGAIINPSSFHNNGCPRAFLRLRSRDTGSIRILDDPKVLRCMILNGLYCGLQCSVIHRRVFDTLRFSVQPKNESEDQIFVARVLVSGYRLAYIDNVHVVYRIHDQNSSAAGSVWDQDRYFRVIRELIAGYEAFRVSGPLQRPDARALRRRLAREYFWMLGYQLWLQTPRHREALSCYRKALALWPWDLACWKTYLLAQLRVLVSQLVHSGDTATDDSLASPSSEYRHAEPHRG